MTIVMYELVGFEGRRPSPFSWRIRYALTHKGVDVDYRPVRFADVDTITRMYDKSLPATQFALAVRVSWISAAAAVSRY